ncbi:TIGR00288 family NYN domain-containing protein [archaeon]|nr:TIGR00288 family NYN domain-containing protein [archaeon]NCP79613.1 TIGR00288 family NYN domain-containing protein [archaeon]NCP98316.1 TIGR00288 family NYN domain-containing protein [archaeon]NCQ07380.1 TIGR00288 family NYN domain-containing protein [archaeon]NCQ51176.1 TIGR00288 family NYN domain-containing protein [archaeon]
MFKFLSLFIDKSKSPKMSRRNNIAIFVDGPNILRKEFNVDLSKIRRYLQKEGVLKVARVYLNQYATDKLMEAVVNLGFETIITVGDVDVAMAVDATDIVHNKEIDTIVFVTRDSDYLPAILKAKKHGKNTMVFLVEEGSATALKNTVDKVVFMDKLKYE